MIIIFLVSLLYQNFNYHLKQDTTLIFYPAKMRDSIVSELHSNKDFWDSTIINKLEIIAKTAKPTRTPNVEINLTNNERIAVLLLDDKKQFIKLLLLKQMEKGKFRVFMNNEKLNVLLETHRANKKPFYILWISNNSYKFQKEILLH